MAKPRYKSIRSKKERGQPQHATRGRGGVDKRVLPSSEKRSEDKKPFPAQTTLPARKRRSGARLPDKTGLILEVAPTPDYAVLDSGNGEKLERYGPLIIRRPEGQAMWLPQLASNEWEKADAVFTGDTDEEGQGRWRYPRLNGDKTLPETWELAFDGVPFYGRFTSFRHTGVFPEQSAHWMALQSAIQNARKSGRPVKMLNLFGYTGLATLVGARAGADVTHVDASKKAIQWARDNQELAGLTSKPVRWICDDAMKFCAREVRREQSYDIILLDPPAYGRGPKGEVWQLFEHLPHMLDLVRELQSKNPLMTVLTSYAIRASHFALHEIMQEVFAGMDGRLESGELVLRQQPVETGAPSPAISTSMFSRFTAEGCEF